MITFIDDVTAKAKRIVVQVKTARSKAETSGTLRGPSNEKARQWVSS